jgi:hypothetical protein
MASHFMPERPKRDATWYAEQAELLWQKAAAAKDDQVLRSSYLGLAREYEKLAATLQRRTV